jgi:predicted DNA binding CopG/RHH family protein
VIKTKETISNISEKPAEAPITSLENDDCEQILDNAGEIKQLTSSGHSASDCSTKMRAPSNVVLALAQGCSIFDIDL